MCTTFGVGELSATCGIAGAASERLPVLHLVGVPSTKLQAHQALLHHTLGDGHFDTFANIARNITCAQASLTSPNNNINGSPASAEIDRVLRAALIYQKPTYLTLPTDLVYAKISRTPLDTPLTAQSILKELSAPTKSEEVQHVVGRIKELFLQAKKPIFIVDACARRFHVLSETKELIEGTGIRALSKSRP